MLAGELINEKDRCKMCRGKKVTQESKDIEIHVDPGMKDGQKITLHGQGDQMVSTDYVVTLLVISELHQFLNCSRYLISFEWESDINQIQTVFICVDSTLVYFYTNVTFLYLLFIACAGLSLLCSACFDP